MRLFVVVFVLLGTSAWAQAEGSALTARRERMIKEGKIVPDRVPGTIDRGGVERAITRKMSAIARCGEEKLLREAGTLPKVVVKFVVEADGKAHEVAIDGTPPRDEKYGECLVDIVKSLDLPKPKGGPVTIRYPFIVCGIGY